MAITASDWLITSDVAHEVAFRVDVPEPQRGRWVLSYLPTSRRLTREQAIAGVVLAEMILMGLLRPGGEFDGEIAALHAGMLGLTVTDVMCLLALRVGDGEPKPLRPGAACPGGRAATAPDRICRHGRAREEVSR
ncbi:hypothetical protein [Nocardia otitidiscaviarum]|uniref:hypothetical protein n=1 Tax=Nocardia otitidiscaviarum TaxID=1823 RepID=UPI001894CA9E|nr:hypothetical protein [Nocardia otitidiscaviarum]MBF6182920.1 hypothetical protein [Nocardia otitidiscaviarum]